MTKRLEVLRKKLGNRNIKKKDVTADQLRDLLRDNAFWDIKKNIQELELLIGSPGELQELVEVLKRIEGVTDDISSTDYLIREIYKAYTLEGLIIVEGQALKFEKDLSYLNIEELNRVFNSLSSADQDFSRYARNVKAIVKIDNNTLYSKALYSLKDQIVGLEKNLDHVLNTVEKIRRFAIEAFYRTKSEYPLRQLIEVFEHVSKLKNDLETLLRNQPKTLGLRITSESKNLLQKGVDFVTKYTTLYQINI
jgi:hypothetical protein